MVWLHRSAILLAIFLGSRPGLATDFFVAPTGNDRGTGSQKAPWSLAKALSHPGAVKPGDTIWLRGGTYTGNFTSYLRGTARAPIVVRPYQGERVTLDGNVVSAVSGSNAPVLSINGKGGFTWYWGFEVTNSSPVRTDTVPCTLCRGDGIGVWARGTKIINTVIHDTGQGILCASLATDAELYGNLIYYNGWTGPDRGHGHGIYTQNYEGGTKLIKHNIIFGGFGYNIHAFGSGSAGFVNSTITENVWFRGPTLLGGLSGFDIGGSQMTGNYAWDSPNTVGYWSRRCNPTTVRGNYFVNIHDSSAFTPPYDPLGRVGLTVAQNTIVGDLDGFKKTDYPDNTYYSKESPPKTNKVVVLPNAYETGRATVVVYNWHGSTTQPVDLKGIVGLGAPYEIRDAQNFYGPPIVTGTYSGGSVAVPMAGLVAATPVGYAVSPPTGPAFNVFVVLSLSRPSKPGLGGRAQNQEGAIDLKSGPADRGSSIRGTSSRLP